MREARKMMSGLVAATALAMAAPPAAAALTAADTTPPVLTVPVKASFLVGSTLTDYGIPDCDEQDEPWNLIGYAPVTFSWSATDASGAVGYDVFEENTATGGDYLLINSRAQSLIAEATTADQSCGGGNWSAYQWLVTARDAAGNETVKSVRGGRMRITQETGQANTTSQYAVSPTVAYSGTWSSSSCACWSAGAVRKTTAKGASVTMTVPVAVGNVVRLALVMSKAPNRGKFKVYVDGVLRSTVDTYSATSKNQVIVWEKALGKGTHKVKVVNEATAGRPRIDLDAILTN